MGVAYGLQDPRDDAVADGQQAATLGEEPAEHVCELALGRCRYLIPAGHNYMGHNYIGHNYMGLDYMGQ